MKTKILYVLVSTENDIYLEQAYLSLYSLRRIMKDAHVVMVMDRLTEESLTGNRKKILEYISEVVVIDLPADLTGQRRSRILKTSCREYISGDYLFIDCDTIIEKPLEGIDDIPYELAACRDTHSSFMENPYREMCLKDCRRLGYDASNEDTYFNSGVILAKDTPMVRHFYKEWHKNWKAGTEKKVNMDQPSFALTNHELGYVIKPLSDIWNCQVIHGVRYLNDAKILHYLCTSSTKKGEEQAYILRDRALFDEIKESFEIPRRVEEIMSEPLKGFPDKVVVLAGSSMQLSNTYAFTYFRNIFGSGLFKIWNGFFHILTALSNKLIKNNKRREKIRLHHESSS